MMIKDIIKLGLKKDAKFLRKGEEMTLDKALIVIQPIRIYFDDAGKKVTSDPSYFEMVFHDVNGTSRSLYSGPPIRVELDLKEFSMI